MAHAPIIGRLRRLYIGGHFSPAPASRLRPTDPGRTLNPAPVIINRSTITVPPGSTAPRANTGPRVSGDPARPTNRVLFNRTGPGHQALKLKENHAGRSAPPADRKAPTAPNKIHAAHTPAGRAK